MHQQSTVKISPMNNLFESGFEWNIKSFFHAKISKYSILSADLPYKVQKTLKIKSVWTDNMICAQV